ncbi:AsmA-like C-terminal region [Roseivivax lentus]|uniref:AsmA-like C-terminal region n=2 Tax=Roseivivax lentus TaxID=633194 RepID=A0A1N7N1J2_9RHOB|nr:AsmA-like C-terminal region [Roseivivax lentus]
MGGWTLGLLASAATLVALLVWSALDRPLDAPDWLRKEVEARIDRALPGLDIGFSDLRVQVLSAGLVRIGLSNLRVSTEDGRPVAALTEMRAGLSARALLSRQLALREAQASGLFLSLERDRDGALSLGFGLEPGQARPDLPTVLARIDAALGTPLLEGLDAVTLDTITLRYDDLRAGRGWTADGGQLVVRREDGRLRLEGDVALLGGAAGLATVTLGAESDIGAQDLSFSVSLENLASGDIATQSPALAWLGALRAPISGALGGYLDTDGTLGGLDVTLSMGAGALQPNPRAEPVSFAGARTAFSYAPDRQTLRFSEIAVDTAVGRARAEGQVALVGGGAAPEGAAPEPAAFVGQFTLSDLAANPRNLFAAPVEIAGAETDLRLTLDPFTLEIGRLRIMDAGTPLRATGRVQAGPEGWSVALDAALAESDPSVVARYWPAALAPRSRDWFVTNVLGGIVHDARLALRIDPARPGPPARHIDLRFERAKVRFAQTLPPIEEAAGQLVIAGNRLSVMLERGRAVPPEGGAIDISGSDFIIADTDARPATGDIRLRARSSVTALLSFLDEEPLRLMARANRAPSLIEEGRVEAAGRLTLPLKSGIRFDDLTLDLSGEVTGAVSASVVPERTLRAERLEVTLNTEALEIAGAAELSGVPAEGSFRLPLGENVTEPARVAARVTLSDEAARAFGVVLPDGLLAGSGPGTFALDLPRDGARPAFTLTSDLAGIALSVPAVGWRLAPGQTGRFTLEGRLGTPVSIDGLALSGAGLEASGTVVLEPAGGFRRLELPQVALGGWFDGGVTLSARGPGQVPAIAVTGGALDLRRATFGTSGGGGPGGGAIPLGVALDTLTVTEGIVFRDLTGSFEVVGGLNGRFETGIVGRSVRLTGAAQVRNGGTAIRLQSEDAGAVLEATGLFRNVDDGVLDMSLVPVPGATGTYDGTVVVREARLRDAPALGAMFDAVSIVGLLDELNGAGIYFTRVDADFRLTPRQVILRRSSATGPSIGISVDGYIDLATKALDLQGVFSPIYFLNAVGQVLTRRGEGLFGFNFTIGGTAARPRVAVNPLSVLTPGMFRELFRRPPPETGN